MMEKPTALYFLLTCLLVLSFFLSFFLGRFSISPGQVFLLVRERLSGIPSGLPGNMATVFFNIRLPRVLGALITGLALSVSGSVFQTTFRNAMVSPDILGATAGAGFGSALALMFDFSIFGIQFMGFLFGLAAVCITYSLCVVVSRREVSTLTLVLTGIVIQALFQALISLVKYTADPYSKLPAITFWLMGSLSSVTFDNLWIMVVPVFLGLLPLFLLRWRLNLLSLPDSEASSMGVNVRVLRIVVIICSTLVTASVVSVTGLIGWVGLIIPHAARMLCKSNMRHQIPAAAMLGGIYLLLVDDIARSLMAMEIPIGILTALVGAPVFLLLIFRQHGT